MSIDTNVLLRTPFTAAKVKGALLGDPALSSLGLIEKSLSTEQAARTQAEMEYE